MKRYVLLSFLVISCTVKQQPQPESLVLTVGSGINPNEPRFGIELKGDTLFYCEEINPRDSFKDTFLYKYSYCIIGKKKVNEMLDRSKAVFDTKVDYGHIADASYYQLDINTEADTVKTTFYISNLETDSQKQAVYDIIALKDCDLKPMEFHDFKSGILQYKLPPPPPPVIMDEASILMGEE
ncbi:hypothetical protein Q763_17240 [Flavobacterium beibuense F44-8]|uniref:Uncharacterized protein n=1 Tax=Flavobacterium beibuense F44-8 TaxID=1406840 RepID=A0A0A2LHN3_9FLAO|nr:hypothetical protein [Flavobacterium beibuense]KGO78579.1 hypothetical protein Q763_17710 [Flavobacterium beibuense F44-8]KGO78653.1 hypothetical protein Q763_17240 [Flavobacterium beibuense F44-8]